VSSNDCLYLQQFGKGDRSPGKLRSDGGQICVAKGRIALKLESLDNNAARDKRLLRRFRRSRGREFERGSRARSRQRERRTRLCGLNWVRYRLIGRYGRDSLTDGLSVDTPAGEASKDTQCQKNPRRDRYRAERLTPKFRHL
jgi:hypothetical protein